MNAPAHLASSLLCASTEKRRALFAKVVVQTPASHATEFREGMHMPGIERALAKSQLLVLPDENLRLTCLDGEVWLTRDRDIEDYILGPGQGLVLRRGDQAVLHALIPSRVRLTAR